MVSDELLARMKLPDELRVEPLFGRIDVRGKRDAIAVSQVSVNTFRSRS